MSTVSLVYASYDRVPAPKGAATHIDAFVRCLAAEFGQVDLLTVAGPEDLPLRVEQTWDQDRDSLRTREYCPGVKQFPLPAVGQDLIERAICFRQHLEAWWQGRRAHICHVRSIFEGYAVAKQKLQYCDKLVYEVNGLPSIELKYHYPQVADDQELLQKLHQQEQTCLHAADVIITVSQVTKDHLMKRGVEADRIRVIPNGVNTDLFTFQRPRSWLGREIDLLYSGTLSSWQGVMLALEALALCRRDFTARLKIVGTARARQRRELDKRCESLGIQDAVTFLPPVSQGELVQLHHAADAIVAPLSSNDRNIVQGCCPLKVLEAMASGTPLISSDLPVVTSLARPGIDALIVRPGSAKGIKDALLRLRHESHLGPMITASARRRVKEHFTWKIAQQSLVDIYRELLETNVCSQAMS